MSDSFTAVARVDEISDGVMKQVDVGGTAILLVRSGDNVTALSANCTHYGAPLAEGVCVNGRITCPWHHAVFDAATGDVLEPPAFDSLCRAEVRVEGGEIAVRIPVGFSDRRTPAMAARDKSDTREIMILGGGAAAYSAIQTLRADGFTGCIRMITPEKREPYDRPNLSKEFLAGSAGEEWMALRPKEFYTEHGVDVEEGRTARRVDVANRIITFEDGERIGYQALLLCTGAIPRKLDIPGADLPEVLTLRAYSDAERIIAAATQGRRAVIAGSSFVGMEAAWSLIERGLSVTVVGPGSEPFERVLGPEIGRLFRRIHEEHGVTFRLGTTIDRVEGEASVRAAVLASGERIDCDLVLAGIGVRPATDFLHDIELEEDGGVPVDQYLKAAEGLYAAGDIASLSRPNGRGRMRVEHWRYALQQGMIAAHNLAGRSVPFTRVPFFWTQQYDVSLRYVGYAPKWDRIEVDGSIDERKFVARYFEGDHIVAVAGVGRDTEMAGADALIR